MDAISRPPADDANSQKSIYSNKNKIHPHKSLLLQQISNMSENYGSPDILHENLNKKNASDIIMFSVIIGVIIIFLFVILVIVAREIFL